MKKKLTLLLLCLTCGGAAILGLAACGGNNDENPPVPPHEIHTPQAAVRENEIPATCTAEGSYDEVIYCVEGGEVLSSAHRTTDKIAHVYVNEICTLCGGAYQSSNGLEFTLNSDEASYTVSGIGTCTDKNVCIPSIYDGLPVTSIGQYAFHQRRKSLISVTIPNGVTSIGQYAFGSCNSLTSVTIGNSMTSIESSAFADCASLMSVNITDVAAWCKISFSNYTSNPLSYAHKLYLNGELVTDLVIPDSITSIGNYAFYDCSDLTCITIPDSVTTIGSSAFAGCDKIIQTEDGVHYVDKWIIGFTEKATSVTLRPNTVGISDFAFSGNLTSVTIPDSVTLIRKFAFSRCRNLTIYCEAENASNDWDSVSCSVVWDCKNNNKDENGYAYSVINGVRYQLKDGVATVIEQPSNISGNIVIPTSVTYRQESYSVTSIGEHAFYNCSSLMSVTIGNSVTSIGESAFYGCRSLTNITVSNSVTRIGDSSFENCIDLTSVTIPNSVISIGSSAFEDCSSLASITMGNGVTEIGDSAFKSCRAFTSVYVTDLATWCKISFGNSDSNPLYYARNLYLNRRLVMDLVIPDDVTSIGNYAFYWCSSLTSVTIENGVTSIGNFAFYSCSNITSVTIPNSVTSIGDSAFRACRNLTSATIGNGVALIGNFAFQNCNKLTSITIPNSVTEIRRSAFENCSGLTSVTIGDSVTLIGDYAFRDCSSLKTVYYGGTAEDWAKISFGYVNTKITSATRYYYSETKPTDGGNYWHYVDGEIVVWTKE